MIFSDGFRERIIPTTIGIDSGINIEFGHLENIDLCSGSYTSLSTVPSSITIQIPINCPGNGNSNILKSVEGELSGVGLRFISIFVSIL